ncbi:MAG: acetate kinase, partial [Eubacteriales bacterium]|nr:acetate kinase [Eubacteriales bacterium]
YSIKKYIGAYAAAMGGLDAIIFTAGIGENDGPARQLVCDGLEFLGVELNRELNHVTRSKEIKLSTENSKVQVWVVPTNEELAIARDTLELVSK